MFIYEITHTLYRQFIREGSSIIRIKFHKVHMCNLDQERSLCTDSSIGNTQSFDTGRSKMELLILTDTTRVTLSFPGWSSVTRPSCHLRGGRLSSFTRTSDPTLIGLTFVRDHLYRC